MRRSDGLVSHSLMMGLGEDVPLSHGGFVIRGERLTKYVHMSDVPNDSIGEWAVIHSVSSKVSNRDGIQSCSLGAFLAHATDSTVYVAAPLSLTDSIGGLIAAALMDLLERRIPFDHNFIADDHEEIYCSELALMLYEENFALARLKRKQGPPFEHSIGFEWAFDAEQFETKQMHVVHSETRSLH